MEELVITMMIKVIKLLIEKKIEKNKRERKKKATKQRNLTCLKNWSGKCTQKYFLLVISETLNRNVNRNCYRKKKLKNNETYNIFHGPLSQEWIDWIQ